MKFFCSVLFVLVAILAAANAQAAVKKSKSAVNEAPQTLERRVPIWLIARPVPFPQLPKEEENSAADEPNEGDNEVDDENDDDDEDDENVEEDGADAEASDVDVVDELNDDDVIVIDIDDPVESNKTI
ncbi:trigger factor-like [Teleopsis dalmanni]|uniref:trigger factor-like n=1 Tax=Teleopsis dalmanni TaxID=139649 RepID=UPI0018CE9A27|nr:trigger factor-like [Teleopsis dalmanni]